jgi:hypothetical protein
MPVSPHTGHIAAASITDAPRQPLRCPRTRRSPPSVPAVNSVVLLTTDAARSRLPGGDKMALRRAVAPPDRYPGDAIIQSGRLTWQEDPAPTDLRERW